MHFWGKPSMPDTANMWIPHTRTVQQFFYGAAAPPELGSVDKDLVLYIPADPGVLKPTIAHSPFDSGNPSSTAVTLYGLAGGYARSGTVGFSSGTCGLSGTTNVFSSGTCGLSGTTNIFSSGTGLVSGTVNIPCVRNDVNIASSY